MKMNMGKAGHKTPSQNLENIIKNNKEFQTEYEKSRNRFLDNAKHASKAGTDDKILEEETSRILDTIRPLPESCFDSIKNYIKTGNLELPSSITKPQVKLEISQLGGHQSLQPSGRQWLKMKIFKHTSKKEYLAAWETVKILQGFMNEVKPQPISEIEKKVIELYESGNSYSDIYYVMEPEISMDKIRKIVSRKAGFLGVTLKTQKKRHTK